MGRPVIMRAYVAPPPGYARAGRRYATVFVVGGYGSRRAQRSRSKPRATPAPPTPPAAATR
jgi:hypothetical protein